MYNSDTMTNKKISEIHSEILPYPYNSFLKNSGRANAAL